MGRPDDDYYDGDYDSNNGVGVEDLEYWAEYNRLEWAEFHYNPNDEDVEKEDLNWCSFCNRDTEFCLCYCHECGKDIDFCVCNDEDTDLKAYEHEQRQQRLETIPEEREYIDNLHERL